MRELPPEPPPRDERPPPPREPRGPRGPKHPPKPKREIPDRPATSNELDQLARKFGWGKLREK
jgi:hypothetical protein